MSNHLLILVLFLLSAESAHSDLQYYITPSLEIQCPRELCTSLSQLAADFSNHTGNETDAISLIFLPGKHYLDREITVHHSGYFSMEKESQTNDSVFIHCSSLYERFIINRTTFALIKGLHLVGCGGNTVTHVQELIVEDVTFQGDEGENRGAALVLNEVPSAKILRSTFINISQSERHYITNFINNEDILNNSLGLNQNDLLSFGGALYITSSNIDIVSCTFEHNRAEMGGALFAHRSTINITESTYNQNIADHSGGAMATIESMVSVESNTVFTFNSATYHGGAILAVGGLFNIAESTFTSNSASLDGGVIQTIGGIFSIIGSSFHSNTANRYGGVIRLLHNEEFSITSCTFTNNTATQDGGVVDAFSGSLNISSSTFSSNSAGQYGGVIYTSNTTVSVDSNTVFTFNSAAYHGGAILAVGGLFNIAESTFTSNSASLDAGVVQTIGGIFSIIGSNFTTNTANRYGGVVQSSNNEEFSITSCTFTNNTATLDGGVVDAFSGTLNISSSIFNSNSAGQYGGVIYTWNTTIFGITNSTFTSNTAFRDGGVLATDSGIHTITSSTFSNNTATFGGVIKVAYSTFTITKSTFSNNNVFQDGGVISALSGTFDITICTFDNNTANRDGGVIHSYDNTTFIIIRSTLTNNTVIRDGGVLVTFNSVCTIVSSTVLNNEAKGARGGVVVSNYSVVIITGSRFTNNKVFQDGGVISANSGTFDINTCTFNNNTATRDGGVIDSYNSTTFNITSSTFTNNTATRYGGVFATITDTCIIASSTFANNEAKGARGGVIVSDYDTFIITNSTFSNNQVFQDGGVISALSGTFDITVCTFDNNTANRDGGVIDSYRNANFHITSSTFTNNIAIREGGVIDTSSNSTFSIISSTFTNNTAIRHGGVFTTINGTCYIANSTLSNNEAKGARGGVIVSDYSTFIIINGTFSNNQVFQDGGVISALSGTFDITICTFDNNIANREGGVIDSYRNATLSITNSTFTNNTAIQFGGVFATINGTCFIASSTFSNNEAKGARGGVIVSDYATFIITNSTFSNNTVFQDGGVISALSGTFDITICTFDNNTANHYGGVIRSWNNATFNIDNCMFTNNTATLYGGVLVTTSGTHIIITRSIFSNNEAKGARGGVVAADYSAFIITNSTFTNNQVFQYGGVISTFSGEFTITDSFFTNNIANRHGGVIHSYNSATFNIMSTIFANNTAARSGGVLTTYGGTLSITYVIFATNKAVEGGGVIRSCCESTITINYSLFQNNSAESYGGIMFAIQCDTRIDNCIFVYNSGSLFVSDSTLIFSGHLTFEQCMEPPNKTFSTLQEGGALTTFQSDVIFTGESHFLKNTARESGAILAIGSRISLKGPTLIGNNTATVNGGGVSLQQSSLEVQESFTVISDNYAMRGGGLHASSSTVIVYQQATLQITHNFAENGSGIYLEESPQINVLKRESSFSNDILVFSDNHANRFGGAIYVADDTNSGACSPNSACFIQTIALYLLNDTSVFHSENIRFSGNTAAVDGCNVFGGLLDRCVPSPFSEVYIQQSSLQTQHYNGFAYLEDLSNISSESMSSLPVGICFCTNNGVPDCSYQPPPIKVRKGETFNVFLVAVDQVNRSIEANIISSLISRDGGFSEGQLTQSVGRNCTPLTFNVFSPHEMEEIRLFADGPCGSSTPSIRHIDILFVNCTCPVGFQPSTSKIRCQCECDSKLSPYLTNCNSTTSSITRYNTNSWITYINDTDPPGYLTHSICPYDYCQPQTVNVSINLNLPNGADAQCAFNRSGILCGACQEQLSLSLGSSRCLPCPSYWPALFVVILLAAIMAGILLVTVLLALNMTVAVGLINGFIFYANIVSANSAFFFPSSEPSFPTVLVAWLNLDFGIDVCFIDGLDAYTRTWIQLAFPVYIITLVVGIIVISEYFSKFAELLGKRDPIAALATLILLSYAKLLSTVIAALSFSVLHYPDGSQETVWLPDGNIKYFQGKHAVLVLVSLFIILFGVSYTILLLLWQWIARAPRWKVVKWTRNTKFNTFISAYHVPHNCDYRYWTGLLLLVRVVLYITASITVSDNPQTSLVVTAVLVGGLFLLKGVTAPGLKVYMYKNSITEIIETVMHFNLLAFAVLSLYDFKNNLSRQTAIAYVSTIITFLLLVGVIAYHVYLLMRKEKTTEETNEYSLAPLQPQVVTHSVVEIQCQPPEADSDEVEVSI